jgi:uncharacterized protein YjbI with pentapeptide repeats
VLDFENQLLDTSPLSSPGNSSVFDFNDRDLQHFSTKGIQLGPISFRNDKLRADLLWDSETLQAYSSKSRAKYSVLLSLVDLDGSVDYVKNITSKARSIYSPKIPESARFNLSQYMDEITGGSSLYLGISQVSKTGQPGKGAVAMATSLDLTDLITGQDVSGQFSSSRLKSRDLLYTPKSTTNCQEKRIGIDSDLQNCKFEYVNLDGVAFGYSNQDLPAGYRKPVNLSGSSFMGSSLRKTEWGWTGIDIIDGVFLSEHTYAQMWTSDERKNDPSAATNLSHSNLEKARFFVKDFVHGARKLNSYTLDPVTPPIADYANLVGIETYSWDHKQESQSPTFVTIENASDKDIVISRIITNIFRPWSTTLSKGQSFQAWGTTGAFGGDDIVIEAAGVQIIANNPRVAEANVKVNGYEVDNSGIVRYSEGGVYVDWLGDQNDAKTWDIKFVN